MNSEFLRVLEYIEKEKGIKRETIISAVEASLVSACRKSMKKIKEVEVEIGSDTGEIKVFSKKLVTKSEIKNSDSEIAFKEAKKIKSGIKEGDYLPIEVTTPSNFGRIAAQTAKQVIIHRIKEAEKDVIFDDFKNRVGELVSGVIRRMERNNIYVDLGKAEGVLPGKEKCPEKDDEYKIGDRIRVYMKEVKNTPKGTQVLVSRSCLDFVKKLLELEIPEIVEGVVQIKAMAREPGYRTKVAVWSGDSKVDPVGACVGMNGSRIKNIVRELNGEKIDIVRWDENISTFVSNALHPAKIGTMNILKDQRKIEIIVDEKQLPLVVGKKGHNIKLTVKLTGWKVDIIKEGKEEESRNVVKENLAEDLTVEYLQKLSEAGIASVDDLKNISDEEIAAVLDVDKEEAKKVKEAVQKFSYSDE